MGRSIQSMTDIVLKNRQRYNRVASELTDREREAVEAATIIETIDGRITIDRRITKEENNHDNRNAGTSPE